MIINNQSITKMTPVLKWAGGKTQILPIIQDNLPDCYNNYFEPFVGGASVLLGIMPETAFINDINPQLINLYKQIQASPNELISLLYEMDSYICDKSMFLSMREKYNLKIQNNEFDVETAALMIWINKHCFNGLYRVNGKGLFNVPYNNKTIGKSFDEDNILAISNYFNEFDVNIFCSDFEDFCKVVSEGDFVYFDSPYIPESETANFTDYTKTGFELSDHIRLAELFKKLDNLGAKVMLSNNDVPLVHSLYEDYKIQSFDVKRMINRNANKRTGKEVIITNY